MSDPVRICRCCLSDGCYKDIAGEYYISGHKEVYADLLFSTFNITISNKEGIDPSSCSRLICEPCIQRLRDAAAFKHQVLDAEKNIDLLWRHIAGVSSPIQAHVKDSIKSEQNISNKCLPKQDLLNQREGEYQNMTDNDSHGSSLDLKEEKDDFSMDEHGVEQEELLVIKQLKKKDEQKQSNDRIKTRNRPLRAKIKNEGNVKIPKTRKLPMNPKTSDRDLKMRENTTNLVLNSNMILFKSLKVRFQCFFCRERFIYAKELRRHCEEFHNDREMIRSVMMRTSSYKNAEISELNCALCQSSCKNIEELQTHLNGNHDIPFEPQGHLLVPFKIEKEYKCAICDAEFNSFLRLHIHMNSHFMNNVCDICAASFISGAGLRLHVRATHRPQSCAHCSSVFSTQTEKFKHVAKVHGRVPGRASKCLVCGDAFKYFYQLHRHKVEVHGGARRIGFCADCNKSFASPANLRIHIRSVHLRERNFSCDSCGSSFFTRTDKNRHEKTHSAVALVSCSHCSSNFKSKDSWRRHMNRQHPGVIK